MSSTTENKKKYQKIEVGDLVYLGSDISSGPIGIVLREIIIQEKDELIKNIEKDISSDFKKVFERKEYRCCMIGKNGKVITMVFSENDLMVVSKGVKVINYEEFKSEK